MAKAIESGIACEAIDRGTLRATDWNGVTFRYGAILEADIDVAIRESVRPMGASHEG